MGIDAVALERDRFPRAKVCGAFVSPGGVKCLDRLGLLGGVKAAGAVDIQSARVRIGAGEVEIPFAQKGMGISRHTLDEIGKKDLKRYLHRDCLVTGPLAYDRMPGDFIAIGDAAGMVDPFCGDGMRHALDSGMLAARVVAGGLRRRASYAEMKWQYEAAWERAWLAPRAMGAAVRRLLNYPRSFLAGLRLTPARFLTRMWD
jgi:flavin-dependent dehydrogenase